MSTLTAAELREALDKSDFWEKQPVEETIWAAARLLADILEHKEECGRETLDARLSDITINDLRVVSRWLDSDLSEKIVRKPTVGELICVLIAEGVLEKKQLGPVNGPGLSAVLDPAKNEEGPSDNPHDICITKDGRNLHDEGYCDVTGQDYNEWRG